MKQHDELQHGEASATLGGGYSIHDPFDFSICLEEPARLTDTTSWHGHMPFAFFLTQILRPRIFVELGTHKGDSYCAFCQAVRVLGLRTACYAIDTWEGDAHTGRYGPEVLSELRAYHDPLYGNFSTLVQSTFDDALRYFTGNSIDLLHIDGLHTYEAVRHDFECWLPKMSARGIMLLHDTNVRTGDFGVWRLWEEVRPVYPHLEFSHASGLGVLAVGKEIPECVQRLLLHPDSAHRVTKWFQHLGDHLSALRRLDDLSALLEVRSKQMADIQANLEGREMMLAQLSVEKADLVSEQTRLGAELSKLQARMIEVDNSLFWHAGRKWARLRRRYLNRVPLVGLALNRLRKAILGRRQHTKRRPDVVYGRPAIARPSNLDDRPGGYQLLQPSPGQPTPRRLAPTSASTASGKAVSPRVVVAGYLNRLLGLGEAARNIVEALRISGLDVNTHTYDVGLSHAVLPEGWNDEPASFSSRYMPRANIVAINPDQAEFFAETVGLDFFGGAYNVGVWAWELPEFPEEWARAADRYQEIWVPSSFTQQAVAHRVRKPVLTMPNAIRLPSNAAPSYGRRHFHIPTDSFVFLFIFDFYSVLERKNPLGLVHAFANAFRNHDSVLLVIKAVNGHADPASLARLKSSIRAISNVRLLGAPLSRNEVTALMSCADCYVSLHRSEGFGMTIAEAMALEKPVIATGWSGNVDFMTINNSFLVEYTLQTLECDFGPYKAGNIWAEPNLDHATHLMREVRFDSEKSRVVALRGAQTIHDHFSFEAVGRRMATRIAAVMSGGTPLARRDAPLDGQKRTETGRGDNARFTH